MRFLSISGSNFRSFASFSCELSNSPTVLVGENLDEGTDTRSNGSGKTSYLFDSLSYALYGYTLGGLRKDELIRLGEEEMWVEVFLEIEGTPLTVRRSKSRGHSETLTYSFDGEDAPSGLRQAQTELEKILSWSFEDFRSFVCVDGDTIKKFCLASDKERKIYLERFLPSDIGLLESYYKKQEKVADQSQGEIATKVSKLEGVISTKKTTLSELDSKISATKNQLNDVEQKLAAFGPLSDVQDSINLERYLRWYNDVTTEYDQKRKNTLHKAEECKKKRQEHDRLTKKLEKLESTPEDVCPTCLRPGWDGAEDYLTAQKYKIKQNIEVIKKENAQLTEQIKKEAQEVKDLKNLLSLWESTYSAISNKFKEAKEKLSKNKEASTLRTQSSELQGKLSSLEEQQSLLPSQISKHEEELQTHKQTAAGLSLLKETYAYWKKAFSSKGIPALLQAEILQELETYVNHSLLKLFDGSLTVSLSAFKEKSSGGLSNEITMTFCSSFGDLHYSMLSQGQRRMVDVSFLIGFRSLLTNHSNLTTDFLFLDEAFASVDLPGCIKIIEALTGLLSADKLVFITHNSSLQQFVPQTILIRKQNGVSFVVEAENV